MEACDIINNIQSVHGLILSNQASMQDVINFLNNIFPFVMKHLNNWKHNQLFMTYGDHAVDAPTIAIDEKSLSDKLTEIQTIFNGLLLIVRDSLQFINNNRQFIQNAVQFEQTIVSFLQKLIKSSFIIEKQPGRVLMKGARLVNIY